MVAAFLLRDAAGDVRVIHDRHVEDLFARARWRKWFEAAGSRRGERVMIDLDCWTSVYQAIDD